MGTFSSRLQDIRRLLRQPSLFVWAVYVVLIPFYVTVSGLPQPGDLMIFFLVPMVLARWDGKLGRSAQRTFRPLMQFTLWVWFVDLAWAVIMSHFSTNLLFPLYYLYNLAIFLTVIVLYRRYGNDFVRLTVQLMFATVAFLVVVSFVRAAPGSRHALFFQNPNQLGYYALLAACVLALTRRRLDIGMLASGIGLTMCAYLALLSASRSALAGIGFLFVLTVFSNPRIIIVAAVLAATLTLVGSSVDTSLDTIGQRLTESRNPNLSFFEQRGYDRIWNNKEYLVTGASEGNNDRFKESTAIGRAEIHSSAGTVLFSYGLIGSALFIMFMARLLRGSAFRRQLMLMPVMFYWVAHQGLRFTMLWILLALFVVLKEAPPAHKARLA